MSVNHDAGSKKEEVPSLSSNRWAQFTMYALLFFPIIDFGLRLSVLHPLGVVWDKLAIIILGVLALIRYLAGYRPRFYLWNRLAGWFIVFGLALMFAGLSHPLVAIQGYRTDVYYIFYAYLIPFVVGPKDVPKLLHVGATVATLIAVNGIYQYITKVPNPPSWPDVGESVRTRVFSVLSSPNELGSYMALSLPLLAGFFMSETHRWRKWLYGFGTIACGITMLLTYTRGAWAALAGALIIMAILFERRLLILLVLGVVVAFFIPPIHHRITDLLSPVYWLKSAQAGRIQRWITAFDKMSGNPLFGVGLGRYGGQVAALYHNGIYSDNYYAKTLGETGLVGLTLFVSFHLALFRDLFRHAIRPSFGKSRFIVLGCVTGLLAVLLHNIIENVFEFGPMIITYFIYATLLLIWGQGMIEVEKERNHETI